VRQRTSPPLPPVCSDPDEPLKFTVMRILVFEIHGKPFIRHGAGLAFVRRLQTSRRLVDSAAPLPYLLSGLITNQNPQEFVAS
jgi:hypothetical protein